MNFIRIYAIAKKEIIQIIRDPLSLIAAFIFPIILLIIFGYAISLDVNNIKIAVYDEDRTSISRDFTDMFVQSGYFKVIYRPDSYKKINEYIDSGKVYAVISIPYDFSEKIRSGKTAIAQAIIDGTDSNTATIISNYINLISEMFNRKFTKTQRSAMVNSEIRIWYNSDLKSKNFIVPGLIAVIMAIIAALLTSLCFAREWERGTMEQLISTPVKPEELIIGKIIPYFLIGIIDVLISVFMAIFIFKVNMYGSFPLLMFLASLFLFGGLCQGILISIATKSQLFSSQFAMVSSFLPAFLLSGFMFAISNMPKPIQIISHIIPARYFVKILKAIFLKGSPISFLIYETFFLFIFGLIIFLLANLKFKKRID